MRIVMTKNLKSGMILGKTVYDTNGGILLNSNVVLNESYIQRLGKKNIPCVYIEDEFSEGINIENAVDEELKVEVVQKIKNIFQGMKPSYKKSKASFLSEEGYGDIKYSVQALMDNLTKNSGALFNMIEVLSTDLATYTHSVNVAILAILTGRALGMDEQKLIQLGIGGLLHDIGMSQIPDNIVNKAERLTEEEKKGIRKHPVYGYQLIKDNHIVSPIVKSIVLLHHEYLDGTGYPLEFNAEKINPYVRIVTICDMFDGMVSERIYKPKKPIYEAFEEMSMLTMSKLDQEIFQAFRKVISLYPQGSGVILNIGERGIVIENNSFYPTRPRIRLLKTKTNELVKQFSLEDLMKNLTLFIEDSWEII